MDSDTVSSLHNTWTLGLDLIVVQAGLYYEPANMPLRVVHRVQRMRVMGGGWGIWGWSGGSRAVVLGARIDIALSNIACPLQRYYSLSEWISVKYIESYMVVYMQNSIRNK